MATNLEVPSKREYDSDFDSGDEVIASKKAKAIVRAVSPGDEIMSEVVREGEAEAEEEVSKKKTCSDDEFMPDSLALKTTDDIVREFQIFLQLQGHSDSAKKIVSEKEAHELFTDEMELFRGLHWKKWWHIRRNPDGLNLNDYERLAVYPSKDHHYYRDFSHCYFTYDYDLAYLKFAKELSENVDIKWNTIMSDARPIAETIFRKHLPDVADLEIQDYDVHLELLDESISTAICNSGVKQMAKELSSLFVDLYKREVDGEDFVQALKEIIEERGMECYPHYKESIEEAFGEPKGGRLLSRYCYMKKFCNIQEREAMGENQLKGLMSRYFECMLPCSSQDDYSEYVKKKISIAQDLGIL